MPIGEKLMERMGWKKTQGVGPRVNYMKKSGMKLDYHDIS